MRQDAKKQLTTREVLSIVAGTVALLCIGSVLVVVSLVWPVDWHERSER